MILLPEIDLAEARQIAECLRLKLEHTPIKTDIGALSVTISVGVTSRLTSNGMTPVHKLVQGADEAMYLAKRAGRNQVVTWQGQEHIPSSTD